MGRPRLEALDGLRFAAAMAVVAYHFTTMDRVWQRPAGEIFPAQTAAYGWLGVHLFFLISGFVICMSGWDRGPGSFLLSRAVRLYPAYWLSVVVIAALKPVAWRDVVVNLTMFQDAVGVSPVAEVYWTLWAELRFYLLFALLVWWGLTYRRVVGFCVTWLGLVAVAKVAVPDHSVIHVVLMTDYAPLFIAGIGCYLMYRFRSTLVTWGIIGGSFVLALPVVLLRAGLEAYPGEVIPKWPAVVVLGVCFALVIAVALGWLSWLRGRWLVIVGAMTYPLYLLHLDLGGPVLFHLQAAIPPAVLVLAVTAAMMGVAWLVHRYVEQPLAPLMKRAAQRIRLPRATDSRAIPRMVSLPRR